MANIYLKSAIVTVVIFLLGVGFVSYLENEKFKSSQETLNDIILDVESTKLLFLYSENVESENFCQILSTKIKNQLEKTRYLISNLEQAKKSSLLTDFARLKKRYNISNTELYFYLNRSRKECGTTYFVPILYFYTDASYKAEDELTGKVLDAVAAECVNVRVFALPIDSDIDAINLLATKFRINSSPAIIINETSVINRASTKEEVLELLPNCSKA